MSKNNTVDTAQKGQTTTKNKVPTGKVKTAKSAEERRKIREEKYRNFRINAFRRRCARMGFSDDETEELVKKLIEQMNAPKQYRILIMCNKVHNKMIKEALAKANINYLFCSDEHFFIDGDQNVLAKIREIAPSGTTIQPYAKKMESIIPKVNPPEKKKPRTKAEKKTLATTAKIARKEKNIRIHRNKKTGKIETRKMSERKNRHSNSTKRYTKKIVLKTLTAVKKRQPGIVVHMNTKKPSEAVKTIKKAA